MSLELAPITSPTLLDLLEVEQLDRDIYRSIVVFDEPFALYGGQVAAQALLAAGRTVPEGRLPHSLHCYYLRGGAAAKPVLFRIDRDRDGRSYSARRVTALQDGEVIFTMSASFAVFRDSADHELEPMPDVPGPDDLPEWEFERLWSTQARLPPQRTPTTPWPSRFWARSAIELPDSPLVHACVLTYLSDTSTGLVDVPDGAYSAGASLDHAVWFHRPARLDDWVLMDLVPRTVAAGRGFYTGTVRRPDGVTVATLTQESLFREPRAGATLPKI
ncbi:thioesterase family protein [Nocardia sp. NBC_00565]|uniref:acyl-CoA thioesterase n=1 Tax=Nocardia sp. NBC_00565 TaxID=2975993 RepID=UPI002E804B94|nr:acyl-CoA thioesterase domain-containing protein [Nocardia sp. NBC_00565]WUC05767.1 thioesterase family protein [Nocardia sp. NBC_00565]